MEKSRLMSCPFCGGQAGLFHGDSTDSYIKGTGYVEAFCGLCGARIRGFNRDEVVSKWNTRPNTWHTGTPTKEGWYLTKIEGQDFYFAEHYYGDGRWASKEVEAWIPITPIRGQ